MRTISLRSAQFQTVETLDFVDGSETPLEVNDNDEEIERRKNEIPRSLLSMLSQQLSPKKVKTRITPKIIPKIPSEFGGVRLLHMLVDHGQDGPLGILLGFLHPRGKEIGIVSKRSNGLFLSKSKAIRQKKKLKVVCLDIVSLITKN